jgi:hypothetical protein
MSDEEQTYPLSPEYMAVDPKEHACDACSNPGDEPIARIEEGDGPVFICARCAKAVVGLLRGLGLTS